MADHDALRAWARGTAALIDEWSQQQRHATDTARQGLRFPGAAETHIRLAAIEARAAARLGDHGRTHAALAHVQALQEQSPDSDEVTDLGGLLSFPTAKQHYYIGSTYGLLGLHDKAEHHARLAITSYETGLTAERSYGDETLARLDVVNARLAVGDVAGAAEAMTPVLNLPEEHRIHQLATALDRTSLLLEQPFCADDAHRGELQHDIQQYRYELRRHAVELPSA